MKKIWLSCCSFYDRHCATKDNGSRDDDVALAVYSLSFPGFVNDMSFSPSLSPPQLAVSFR